MKKKLALVLTAVFVLCLFAGCGKKDNSQTETTKAPEVTQEVSGNNDSQTQEPAGESETLKEKVDVAIGALKGPTALGMLKMMEDAEAGTAANNYKFTIAGAADEITASIIKGDIPIAAVPCNLASVLYNKSKGGVTIVYCRNRRNGADGRRPERKDHLFYRKRNDTGIYLKSTVKVCRHGAG